MKKFNIVKIYVDDYVLHKLFPNIMEKLPIISESKIMRKKGYIRRIMLLVDGIAEISRKGKLHPGGAL